MKNYFQVFYIFDRVIFKLGGMFLIRSLMPPRVVFNVDDKAAVMPSKTEWLGFVLNSRLLWKESVDDRPAWVKDVNNLLDGNEGIEDSPLSFHGGTTWKLIANSHLVSLRHNCAVKEDTMARGSKSKSSKEKQEPKAIDGIKVPATR
ncbi:hypothetical protein Rs2_47811 [Raphanus sativus]|nr:hypothetical protein Rs2_47811 [Raphanus sativus]